MHISSVATLLLRYHDNPTIQSLLKRLDKDKLVGTLCYSDPTTGLNILKSCINPIQIGLFFSFPGLGGGQAPNLADI